MAKFRNLIVFIIIIILGINFCLNGLNSQSFENEMIEPTYAELKPADIVIESSSRAQLDNSKLTLLAEGLGAVQGSNLGSAASGAGDLNSDGFDDIIISAPYASPFGKSNAGEVYIFYGAEDFALKNLDATKADVTISGTTIGEHLGECICIPGDLNDDDINDIIIGAPDAVSETGKIYIFYSSTLITNSNHSASSADLTIQGSSAGERFGVTIVGLGDVNSDQKNDIMVGAPDSARAYILYGPGFGASERTTLVGPAGSQFGAGVSGGTDLNNDGHLDFVVGAPTGIASSGNKGQVFLFFGYDNFHLNSILSSSNANNFLIGTSVGNLFGQCLSSRTDINKDGFFDIIVSAPGEDAVYIYYGNTLTERYSYPNLWNMPNDPAHPVSFESGVFNDVGQNKDINTYGLGNGDDGWDWSPNVFGTSRGTDMDFIYAPWEPFTADAEGTTLNNVSKLEVIVGRSNTQVGPAWNRGPWWNRNPLISDSGAWGIEFKINSDMFDNISQGCNVNLEFDWEAYDAIEAFGITGQGTEEICYVKAKLSSSKTTTYLGTDLGGDTTAELFFEESPSGLNAPFDSASEHFETCINDIIESSGSYYLELGARFETTYNSDKANTEGLVAFFDNITIWLETPPIAHSLKIKGVTQSQFGHSFTILEDQNNDGFDELAISAPHSNLAGTNSGTVYIINGGTDLRSQINSNEAQRIITGLAENENFGTAFRGAGDLNGDGYKEFIIGAPGHSSQLGKIYVFSPCQKPEISIINPKGGMVFSGDLNVLVDATDYEKELDKFGVSFYYSKSIKNTPANWQLLSQVITPDNDGAVDVSYQYSKIWDTSEVSDGLYLMKVIVTDNTYLSYNAISEQFEINNPDIPTIKIVAPVIEDETYSGIISLKANCTDLDNDLNYTTFYYSEDGESWNYVGIDYTSKDSTYQVDWDTEDITDGNYVILARANDTIGLSSEAKSVQFNIHNPGAPSIGFLLPSVNDTLKGYSKLEVFVRDKDNNIDSSGVTFSYSRDKIDWIVIETVSEANVDSSYSTFWDTLKIQDGYYFLTANVKDTTELSAEVILGPIKVDNPSTPTITLEPLKSPVAGKVTLKAICADDDDDLSGEGVIFYVSINNENWWKLGDVSRLYAIKAGQNTIFELEWDTTTNETPDDPNYRLRATIKDATNLESEVIIGPFQVNNPDKPTITMGYPSDNDKLSGSVKLGAYAEDPDNDIDARGVTFYFSKKGNEWYLIDSASEPVSNSTLYQFEWNTKELANGDYQLKAEVIDRSSFRAETIIKFKIDNAEKEETLKLSSTFWSGSIALIIIIILLAIFLTSVVIKKRKREEKLREEAERKKLVKTIREEMLQQTGRYPVLMASPQTTQELPALPPATAVQPAGAGTSAVQMPLLPPHQPIAAAGQTQDLSLEGHPYKPKVGLTPGELNKNRSTDAGGPTPVVAGTPRSQTQTPVQVSVATLKQQTVSSTSPSKTPTPTPTPTPIPTPTPTPTSPVIPTINQPQVQPRPPGEKVDAKKGGGSV